MHFVQPITLKGTHATLIPLEKEHCDGLIEAVKDGELWKLWYTLVPSPENMAKEIDRRLDEQTKGIMMPFTIIDNKTGKICGMTTYFAIDKTNRRVEIGYTCYSKSTQKTALNTECKIMLLTHAFEVLDCIAVVLGTSTFNHNSRRAIERIGAKLDGIIRNKMIQSTNGIIRDSCLYSIIQNEWPAVKMNLQFKLSESTQKKYAEMQINTKPQLAANE